MAWIKKKTCNEDGCTYPVWSKNKCKKHQPKKEVVSRYEGMIDLFWEIWDERPHRCYNCGCSLGSEPSTAYFHHILEKSKYPQFALLKNNIVLLCLDDHANVKNLDKIKLLTDDTEKRLLDPRF